MRQVEPLFNAQLKQNHAATLEALNLALAEVWRLRVEEKELRADIAQLEEQVRILNRAIRRLEGK